VSDGSTTSEEELLTSVADALLVLSNVAFGDYETRLPDAEGDDSTLGRLFRGINEMIHSLQAEEARTTLYQKELEEKLTMIEQQRLAIRELSTPIMEVWDGVLCLPVVGVMDTLRSDDITNALLRSVIELKADYVIIDITGIEVMDTRTVDHFMRMAKSMRLLGAHCALTGINANIAQTVVHMGVDINNIVMYRSLRDALVRIVGGQGNGWETGGGTRLL
jgi:rsbT co-antagonist protein RsbR